MTYTALATLLVLGDDLSRINRENLAQAGRGATTLLSTLLEFVNVCAQTLAVSCTFFG